MNRCCVKCSIVYPVENMSQVVPLCPRCDSAIKLYQICAALCEFWANGSPVHPGAIVVDELKDVMAQVHSVYRLR